MYNDPKHLINSLTTSFLDKNNVSDENYHTKLLVNDYKRGVKVLRTIQQELLSCDEFLFSVAFITEGGLNVIANELRETAENGIRGKILTSSYLYFNNPKMFRKLLRYPNIDIRIYEEQPLHAKGYLFKKDSETTFVIGSSNLTDSALCTNSEWNIKLTSFNSGQIITDSLSEFSYVWDRSNPLTEEWISNYEKTFVEIEKSKKTVQKINKDRPLVPNKMQVLALKNLDSLRKENKDKALLISSTGTGKTYLSAFDVKNFNPKRMLFIIHREQIAKEAMASFKRVMPNKTMGIYSGNHRQLEADFIFTTVQTMSKENSLSKFAKDAFDYIIIDEAHRSGAGTYGRIINHFEPKFLLGMTATPERTDGLNIFETFDYNIAYEIRLQQAMEEEMLCPFHYFGVTELLIDDEVITDKSDFNKLISKQRIDHIIENIEYYGYSGDRVKGLIFCSRNEEAVQISELMNRRGYKTQALSGSNSQEEREFAVDSLVSDKRILDYIITVDIFNEGIDIPELNQIVMLRPTQSSIVFVQQLGRGLRLNDDKEYVNVIDFIGNYQNNFLIPIALSGDTTYEKDSIKRFMIEGNSTLPGSSTINFDKISRNRIYEALNKINFSTIAHLRSEYAKLKNRLGRIPMLVDYINEESIDPRLIFDMNSRQTYHNFLEKVEPEYQKKLTNDEEIFLSIVSQEMASGKRDIELRIIKHLLDHGSVQKIDLKSHIIKDGDYESSLRIIDTSFLTSATRKKFENKKFIMTENDITKFSPLFKYSNLFKTHLYDLVEYGLKKYALRYSNRSSVSGMVLYERYTRKDMCKYFNWQSDMSGAVFGYLIKENTFPIFVTYHKDENISESINYDDKFINNDTFSWMSKGNRTLESNEIKALKQFHINDIQISLFVKKEDGELGEFFYLGEMVPMAFKQTNQDDDKKSNIVNVKFKLKNPVRDDIYHFLTES